MKKILLAVLTIALLPWGSAFAMGEGDLMKVLQQLGISAQAARDYIWSSLSGGYLSYPSPARLKQIATGDRAAIVREIGALAKSYARSEEFRKKYLEYRENRKPSPPEKPASMAEQKKTQKEELQTAIKNTEEAMKSMSADQQGIFKESLKMLQEQLKQVDDPNNPMFTKEMEQMRKQMYEGEMEEHRSKLAAWEKEYPTNPNPMIAKWLSEFLEVSKDVDFNAALVTKDGGRKVFAKEVYESKSPEWKMCYRAGREAVQAGRAVAQEWLKELNQGK